MYTRTDLCKKHNAQKQHAKRRGIEWQFNVDTWIAWWGDDITKRGSRKGQLVMARNGDTGPYHPDNVRKITVEANILEARCNGRGFFQHHTAETRAKISAGMKEVCAYKYN
jgi:hypothetical protein